MEFMEEYYEKPGASNAQDGIKGKGTWYWGVIFYSCRFVVKILPLYRDGYSA